MLSNREVAEIKKHVAEHPLTLATIRTQHAPTELDRLLKSIGRACRMKLTRHSWSPSADFGFAEFDADGRSLVLLWVGGLKTELVSVSETDRASILDLEQEVFSTNIHSSSIRDGL